MARKSVQFPCSCRVTTQDIATAVGHKIGRFVQVAEIRFWRARLAQEYCDRMFSVDEERACIGNPYLPNAKIGNNYIFTGSRANRLVKMIVNRLPKRQARWQQYVPQSELVTS